jgi:hypothetical protein
MARGPCEEIDDATFIILEFLALLSLKTLMPAGESDLFTSSTSDESNDLVQLIVPFVNRGLGGIWIMSSE